MSNSQLTQSSWCVCKPGQTYLQLQTPEGIVIYIQMGSWTHHTVLIPVLKNRYPCIIHLQIVKWQFREALSCQREKPITQAPHNQHFTLGTPHSQPHTWTIFFLNKPTTKAVLVLMEKVPSSLFEPLSHI